MNNTVQPTASGDFKVLPVNPVIFDPITKEPLTIEIHHIKRDTAENLKFWNELKNEDPETFKGYEPELNYWNNLNEQLKKIQ